MYSSLTWDLVSAEYTSSPAWELLPDLILCLVAKFGSAGSSFVSTFVFDGWVFSQIDSRDLLIMLRFLPPLGSLAGVVRDDLLYSNVFGASSAVGCSAHHHAR